MPASPASTTSRGRATRERILAATAQLVAERGFHSVGVSDIGAAAGVSGAALYRHFETKTAILVELFEGAVDGLLRQAVELEAGPSGAPGEVLERLIAAHVEFALAERATLAVYARDSHDLPDVDRRRLRRMQRQYVEIWARQVASLRPELGPEAVLARVEAVFGLLNSAPDLARSLDDDVIGPQMRAMAEAALRVAPPIAEPAAGGSRGSIG
jgi:AcrR family transcriptional regulator